MKGKDIKKIINVIGGSATGKSSLVHQLLIDNPYIEEIVSCTDRAIRTYDNEVEGKDYYFKTKEEMLQLAKNGEFAEFNDKYVGDTLYGITKREIENKFKDYDTLCVITDMNGNKQLKELYGDKVITVFIFTDEETIKERLIRRGDSMEKIQERISKLHQSKELENYKYADFAILNKNFSNALSQLKAIVEIINS